MSIKGFQGTSLLDYPGHIASLVFFGGCNLTCPFCHNPALVLSPGEYPDISIDDLLSEIESRSTFIDGVVVSGGEPTLSPELFPLLEGLKALGLLVKLDTNGLFPDILERLLCRGLLDYVALDIKTSPTRYGELHSSPVDSAALVRSIGLLKNSTVKSEFRTTCVPLFVSEGDLHEIGELISGSDLWVLQQFDPRHALAEGMKSTCAYGASDMERFVGIAREYVEGVELRGL